MMSLFRGRVLVAILSAFLASFAVPSGSRAEAGAFAPAPALLPLTIVTANGARHGYRVEVARTAAEQARGLMYRRAMPRNRGMLFPFPRPRHATFWMANTYIPLDMLFITAEGRIESIIAQAAPESTTIRPSEGPVTAVLELNGGEAARIGAKPGDRVRYDLGDLPPAAETGSNAAN